MSLAIADLLDDHLAALRSGRDTTAELVEAYGAIYPELPNLLRLGKALLRSLEPVSPQQAFVARLATSLIEQQGYAAKPIPSPVHPGAWLRAAAVGSLLSFIGILWIRSRRSTELDRRAVSTTA